MASLQIKVEGIKELQTYLNEDAPEAIKQGVIDSLADLSYDIYNTTTALCPIDTGALLRSIQVTTAYDQLTAIAGEDYASYVDEGTSRMRAQPFFQSPIADILQTFSDNMSEKIANALGSQS